MGGGFRYHFDLITLAHRAFSPNSEASARAEFGISFLVRDQ